MDMEYYNKVFNSDGTIRVCGRDLCKKLIAEADRLEPGISHGNLENGYMNIESIQRLHERK